MQVRRLAQQVMIVGVVTVMCLLGGSTSVWAGQDVCDCPHAGDADGNGVLDIVDMMHIIDAAFNGGPIIYDPNCPKARADWNADGIVDVRDVQAIISYIFETGLPLPVNPCNCLANPPLCAPVVDPAPGTSGNSVTVESKTVFAGETGVTIGIKITNNVVLRNMVVPLVARSTAGGAFINSVQMNFGDRLAGNVLGAFRIRNVYADPNGTCSPQGFGGPSYTNGGNTNQPFPPRPVASSPEGLLFAAFGFLNTSWPYLNPGADVTGSLILTVNLTNTSGSFEIDTTCTDPANHLQFMKDDAQVGTPVVPAFTKGTITAMANTPPVAQCSNLNVPAGSNCTSNVSIDNGSYDPDGGPVTITQTPPGPYSKGTTMVTLIVTDIVGAADTCQANVTVTDQTPPVISHPDSVNMRIGPVDSGAVINYICTASDNCPGVTETCMPPSGSFFRRGSTLVTCIATDAVGLADTAKFVVTAYSDCFDRMSDVNCDGLIDVMDVVKLIDIAFGNAAEVPCPTPK